MKTKPVKPTRGDNTGKVANETTIGQVAPQAVRFEYVNGNAQTVQLAGTFNNWRPESMEMISLSRGEWAKDLWLPPGSYEYRLVVDGQWLADPENRERVPNPFGGQNSVKVVLPAALRATLLLPDLTSPRQSAWAKGWTSGRRRNRPKRNQRRMRPLGRRQTEGVPSTPQQIRHVHFLNVINLRRT